MKKLFFSRSYNGGKNNPVPPPATTDEQCYSNNLLAKQPKNQDEKNPVLRRSLSFSSAACQQKNFSCLSDRSRSPSTTSSSGYPQQSDFPARSRSLTPERHPNPKLSSAKVADGQNNPSFYNSSKRDHDSSESSSFCSTNSSNKAVDLYIDGEHHQERNRPKSSFSQRKYSLRRPPRVQYTAPASPTDSPKLKTRSHSYIEKASQLHFSTNDWTENGFGHESPRMLAKNVIERLSQSHLRNSSLKDFDSDLPNTIEDVCRRSFSKCSGEKENQYENPKFYYGGFSSVEVEEEIDVVLHRKCKEARERVAALSEELEREDFLQDSGFNVPTMIQTIRDLLEERISMAVEVSSHLQSRISEREAFKEEIKIAKFELEGRSWKLEKEKNQLQFALEKEIDRRSSDWSIKLEKYQSEEKRLRERVRELAEQNVSLQRELSSLNERESDSRSLITHSEMQIKDLKMKVDESADENQALRQYSSELEEKYRTAEEDRDSIGRKYEEKEKECKDLHVSVTRLLRTCNEQEKTIDGLRQGLDEEIEKKQFVEKCDSTIGKLKLELMRLTGVEQTLRREIDSYRLEVDSLRHENIDLLNRLKGNGNEIGFSSLKLDQEIWARIRCLQNQGLCLLNESTGLCSRLLEFSKQGTQVVRTGVDEQFLVESDMKLHGFKRKIEIFTRSLQTISSVLNERCSSVASEFETPRYQFTEFQDLQKAELRAESLLTSLLRERLYSKEMEVEQLQAELATAVRGHDILQRQVQNSLDELSCATHKMKDLEIQMMKKEENIKQLENNLQEYTKELTVMRGILPKVSEERDLMWDEVRQYSEKNMLLNSEVNILKKKIESLDEDILLKEGQITILKDTLGNIKPFDLLSDSDSTREFLLE